MAKERRKLLLPLWAYVLLNLLFLGALATVYILSEAYARNTDPQFPSAGVFPVLLVTYAAFTFVCIFDAIFDRVARRQRERRPAKEEASVSQDDDE